MRKVIRAFCSAMCVMSLAMPADVLANQGDDQDELVEDQVNLVSGGEDYSMVFTLGDFDKESMGAELAERSGSMVMFISRPDGQMVTDAQVITTLIDPQGTQVMRRAEPFLGGYLVASRQLPPGRYRIEAEVITDGRLLTDEVTYISC